MTFLFLAGKQRFMLCTYQVNLPAIQQFSSPAVQQLSHKKLFLFLNKFLIFGWEILKCSNFRKNDMWIFQTVFEKTTWFSRCLFAHLPKKFHLRIYWTYWLVLMNSALEYTQIYRWIKSAAYVIKFTVYCVWIHIQLDSERDNPAITFSPTDSFEFKSPFFPSSNRLQRNRRIFSVNDRTFQLRALLKKKEKKSSRQRGKMEGLRYISHPPTQFPSHTSPTAAQNETILDASLHPIKISPIRRKTNRELISRWEPIFFSSFLYWGNFRLENETYLCHDELRNYNYYKLMLG